MTFLFGTTMVFAETVNYYSGTLKYTLTGASIGTVTATGYGYSEFNGGDYGYRAYVYVEGVDELGAKITGAQAYSPEIYDKRIVSLRHQCAYAEGFYSAHGLEQHTKLWLSTFQ